MGIAAWGNARGRGWANGGAGGLGLPMPAMDVAVSTVAPGATGMVHRAMEMVLLGIGEPPSHSSPDRPIAPYQRGVFLLLEQSAELSRQSLLTNDPSYLHFPVLAWLLFNAP